eukprot:2258773-Pleurochrysis_carterae.AAC.2
MIPNATRCDESFLRSSQPRPSRIFFQVQISFFSSTSLFSPTCCASTSLGNRHACVNLAGSRRGCRARRGGGGGAQRADGARLRHRLRHQGEGGAAPHADTHYPISSVGG